MSTSRLATAALVCLSVWALLALALAHGTAPLWFERPFIDRLGRQSAVHGWENLAELLGPVAMVLVLAASFAFGLAKRAVLRVSFYAVLAVATILLNDHLVKQVVDRTYTGALTFPSGHVTAACATACAMWLALFPLLGRRERILTALAGVAWIGLISLAVVGALWHTPLDAIGSVLFSIGVVSAGGAVFESPLIRNAFSTTDRHPPVSQDSEPASRTQDVLGRG